MNKKKLAIISVAVVLAAAAVIILCFAFIERPAFQDIKKDEIASASYFIYYYENNEPVYLPLPEENVDELLGLMQDIKIKGFHRPDAKYYNGGVGFMFKIQFNNGRVLEFSAKNPHMKINGRYYRTEYAPANALTEFWQGFVETGRKEYGLKS